MEESYVSERLQDERREGKNEKEQGDEKRDDPPPLLDGKPTEVEEKAVYAR